MISKEELEEKLSKVEHLLIKSSRIETEENKEKIVLSANDNLSNFSIIINKMTGNIEFNGEMNYGTLPALGKKVGFYINNIANEDIKARKEIISDIMNDVIAKEQEGK